MNSRCSITEVLLRVAPHEFRCGSIGKPPYGRMAQERYPTKGSPDGFPTRLEHAGEYSGRQPHLVGGCPLAVRKFHTEQKSFRDFLAMSNLSRESLIFIVEGHYRSDGDGRACSRCSP